MIEKEFIPYELALKLKQLGFNEPCIMQVSWLNDVHKDTKIPFGPIVYINGKDIQFEYDLPKKHPIDGFNCLELNIPTYAQAFRWFREKYKLDLSINTVYTGYNELTTKNYSAVVDDCGSFTNVGFYKTYEEAELACLKKLIEIVKERRN